jgi:class 3 adenylate cyclase/DNA-binding SARP family transcriptional activator
VVQEPEVLTVLFTDLVGSTSMLSALGDDAADEVRRSHFSILRRAIDEHRGSEVKSVGDGLMVAFASAREAVSCAAEMQQAVSAQEDRLELRVGIDAGEPIHDGGDLYGMPVVVARRLCDAASGGQVLVSDVVRMLSERRLELPLDTIGPLLLKGIDKPVVAHAVRWHAAAPKVRLCGVLSVEHGGERLDERLPSRQARMLFALLVLERSRPMPRHAIADALWPDLAPRSRDSSIRALLTGVRRVFGADSVEGRESVRLVLPAGASVDVEDAVAALAQAEAALARGDHEKALRPARRAADLTADELLAGMSAPWIDERRAEVEQLFVHALELDAQASLQSGRPQEAERAARRVLERAPYRESAHGLLMQALAARGNLAEATLAYDRLRTLLRDGLGTVPAPSVVALHDRLLAGDASTAAAPPPTAAAPTDGAAALPAVLARAADRPFVARTEELGKVRAAWEAARRGEGRLVVLLGEPGIGKTTLAARFAREAHSQGAIVVLGRCHSEALVPYEPFVELLRQLPEQVLREHADALARVMPELAPSSPTPVASADDPSARYLLFDAVWRALAAAVRDVPLLIVLEDLHWAEPPTLLLLRHVARAAEQASMLLMLSYRTTEVPGTERVVRSLTDLARELPVERVTLDGLGDDEVAEMIGALEGRRPSPVLGSAMRRDTAGNPLFVAQLLRHLEDKRVLVERNGELSLAARDEALGVPESAKELVGERLSALAPEIVASLRTAAVIGRAFGHELVAAVDERPGVAVLDALEQGQAAGLVEEVAAGRHAFVHALVREAIYDQAGAARRSAVHLRVAETLEASGAADPAELAHHFLAAGDRTRGLEYSVASARRALDQLAYEDAAAHYDNALAALGDADPERRCDLLLALGDARAREGATPAAKRSYREAADIAEARGLPEHLARAALGYGGRLLWEVSRDDPDLAGLLERALDRIGHDDSPLRVRLLARLGGGPLRDDHDPTRRRAIAREALEAARRLGDAPTITYGLAGYIAAHHSPEHTAQQTELATELIELALQAGDVERAIEAHEHRAAARTELGDIAGANADVDAMARLAADLRQAPQDWFVAERRAVRALHEGRLADAEALVADARRIGQDAMQWSAAVTHVLQLVVLRRLQGRLAGVEPAARAAAEEYATSYPLCRCAHLHVLAELGRSDEARAGLNALAPHGFDALDFDETWLAAVAFLGETAYALGEAGHAATLYEQLAPYADRVALSTPEISVGSVSRYLGLLAAASGRTEAAGAHFDDAIAYDTRTGARPYVALALENHAVLAGDRELLAQAIDAYAALGMDVLAERASRLL